MKFLNITAGDILDGARACGLGNGPDETPYGGAELGLAAGVPSGVIVIVVILAIGYKYLDALREMLRMTLVFLSRHLRNSRENPGGQNDLSFELPDLTPPVGQGPPPGVPVLSESVLVDLMPEIPERGYRWV